ncbi:MAG: TonB-dependent receptor [Magnetococcales bacterium]|nr:TonB-dependent receptor [Magnetococcales bacterium]
MLSAGSLAQQATSAHAAEKQDSPALEEITVTATREGELKSETPATVNIIREDVVQKGRPSHPKEIMNQVPGVWVSNLAGEGHSTAIRHPLTTNAVYLYLEDGIPTRSTGFFNHNALYEINLPQAGGIEISKGPGSALYGSDAIGGTINVMSRTPPKKDELELTGEVGSYGWGRLLLSGGMARESDAWRANLNLTRTDGWQEGSSYDRETGSVRWDRALTGNSLLKVLVSFAQIDQNHVGDLNQADYDGNPRKNNTPFSYRQVEALRLSAAYEQETAHSLLSFTPYFRHNVMEIIPNWSLSYDPAKYTVRNDSFGLLSKYRQDFAPLRTRLIGGLDVDYSPGSHSEDAIRVTRTGTVYSSYDSATRIYDYDVTYRGISPYIQGEFSPLARLRLTTGLRYDTMHYEYDNLLPDTATLGPTGAFPAGGWYGHVADGSVTYTHLSPKLGATFAFTPDLNGFISYSNSFRAPSEGQVFRGSRETTPARAQLAAQSQRNLKPVTVDNYETGLRGQHAKLTYEVSLFHMYKKDDLISYQDPVTTQRTVVNAGETSHRGVEASIGFPVGQELHLDSSLSYTQHTYDKWSVSGTADYSGKEMETAPRMMANTRLTIAPEFMQGGTVQATWTRLGSYWRDPANTSQYEGHDLIHMQASYPLTKKLEIYGKVNNLFDKKYAETSGLSAGAPTYTVGQPRVMFMGLQATW